MPAARDLSSRITPVVRGRLVVCHLNLWRLGYEHRLESRYSGKRTVRYQTGSLQVGLLPDVLLACEDHNFKPLHDRRVIQRDDLDVLLRAPHDFVVWRYII
jgi:hypothetical protein